MERKQQDRVMQFLRGLNDQFSTIRYNVLMMDPLPSRAKVFSYAAQQEREINNNEMIGSMSLINSSSIESNQCIKHQFIEFKILMHLLWQRQSHC